MATKTYSLFYDACMMDAAQEMANAFRGENVLMLRDEHYQCHKCNDQYAFVESDLQRKGVQR